MFYSYFISISSTSLSLGTISSSSAVISYVTYRLLLIPWWICWLAWLIISWWICWRWTCWCIPLMVGDWPIVMFLFDDFLNNLVMDTFRSIRSRSIIASLMVLTAETAADDHYDYECSKTSHANNEAYSKWFFIAWWRESIHTISWHNYY